MIIIDVLLDDAQRFQSKFAKKHLTQQRDRKN